MNAPPDQGIRPPLKRNPKLLCVFSLVIALLLLAASLVGILDRSSTYPSEELVQAFLPTDVSVLLIGLPMILGSVWLVQRGELIGLLLWPGALFFVFYNYLVYILAMPLGVALLLHIALVTLSAYTLMGVLAAIDINAVRNRLAERVPARLTGGILAGFGFVFVARAAAVMVAALADHEPLTGTELALNISDFIISPAWMICGVLLWKREAFGLMTGLGMLFQASMLFIGLIINLFLQPLITSAAFNLMDVVIVFAMGFICFIPFVLYIRGITSN